MAHEQQPIRIAVLMDIAVSKFQEEPKSGICKYLDEQNIEAVFFGIGSLGKNDSDQGKREAFLDMICPEEFDGIIVLSSSLSNSDGIEKLKRTLNRLKNLPIISIGSSIDGEEFVSIDNSAGINAIMQHLLCDHKYTQFAYISGPLTNREARERYDAFCSALKEARISFDDLGFYEGNFTTTSGQEAISVLFDERQIKPQVIVCANDYMAIGAWNGLMTRRLSVPHDVALTGFDDLQVFHSLSNQFTTVRQPFSDLGYFAAMKLHSLIIGQVLDQKENLPVYLRVRTSCGCLHLEKRKSTISAFCITGPFQIIKEHFLAYAEAGFPQSEENELLHLWSSTIHDTLQNGRPVYELEETLRDLRFSVSGNRSNGKAEKILALLHIALLEECGQYVFMDYSMDMRSSTSLRIALAQLHKEMTNTLTLEGKEKEFDTIAKACGTRLLQIVRFTDNQNSTKKGEVIFSQLLDGSSLRGIWNPAQGSWFPRGKGSMVANIISFEGITFGYSLIDANIKIAKKFDELRVNLNTIFSGYVAMKKAWQLNEEMTREISARKEAEQKLIEAMARVEQMSIEDELTSLRNRRGFLTLADQHIKYLRREKLGFSILFADLNGLKKINDLYGHKDGDLAIKAAAEVLKEALRDSDIIARLGGDEFTALISNIGPEACPIIKERIKKICEKKNREFKKPWQLSISIGHFYAGTDCSLDLETMLEKADEELYKEKALHKEGRVNDNLTP